MPKWAVALRDRVENHEASLYGDDSFPGLQKTVLRQGQRIADLSSRLGTSTPLIIWNIAVLIAIAGIAAKVWGYAPY